MYFYPCSSSVITSFCTCFLAKVDACNSVLLTHSVFLDCSDFNTKDQLTMSGLLRHFGFVIVLLLLVFLRAEW